MRELFQSVTAALRGGKAAVICTVIKTRGSTPRDAGAVMAVFADGSSVGSIGGGSVEYQCTLLAQTLFEAKADTVGHFVLTAGQAADIGMICGGDQDIYLHYIPDDSDTAAALADAAAESYDKRQNSWLFTRMEAGGCALCDLYTEEDGFLLGRFEIPQQPLPAHETVVKGDLCIQPLSRSDTVYVFGAGHVARALVPLLAGLGFSVAVYDQRPELARAEFFPGAVRVICAPYEDIAEKIHWTENDYAVVMTPGHEGDLSVQKQLLDHPPRYIGVIGSHRKAASQRQTLEQQGYSEHALARIHSPVGLPIGASTPAEIAVSVAAEMIQIRSREK